MNLIQQAEQLKSLPDQALAQMQQRPTDVPPYLIVAEMQRRASMRKAFQGMQAAPPPNQPPVAQQLAQPQPQPQQMPMQAPGMAGGGLASLAGYFNQMGSQAPVPEVDASMLGMAQFPGDPRWDEMRKFKTNPGKPKTPAEFLEEFKTQRGESPLAALEEQYAKEESDLRGKKPSIGQILMNLGLGMAASRRPDWGGAIGEGGMNAMQGFVREKERSQVMADRIAEKRLRAIEGKQRHDDRLQDYAIDAARSAQSGYNTDRANDTNIELGIMRQQKEEDLARMVAERQITAEDARFRLAQFNAEQEAKRRMDEKVFDRETQLGVAKIRNQGKAGKGGDPSLKDNAQSIAVAKQFDDQAEAYEKQSAAIAAKMLETPVTQRESLQKKIMELDGKAMEARQRSQALLDSVLSGKGGAAPPQPKQSSGLGRLIDDFAKPVQILQGLGGARTQPAARPPLVIPPPR
jgi:hypothetical protein